MARDDDERARRGPSIGAGGHPDPREGAPGTFFIGEPNDEERVLHDRPRLLCELDRQ
jgi:hypothetical protein